MKFSKDFKFKTKDDYLAEYEVAKKAGAGISILQNIQDEIMKMDMEDNPEEMKRYSVQQRFLPFRDKNESQITVLLAKLPADNYYVTLWTYFPEIFAKLVLDDPKFYNLAYEKQVELVQAKTNKFIERFKVQAPVIKAPVV